MSKPKDDHEEWLEELNKRLLIGSTKKHEPVSMDAILSAYESVAYAGLSDREKFIMKHIDELTPSKKLKFLFDYTRLYSSFLKFAPEQFDEYSAMLRILEIVVTVGSESSKITLAEEDIPGSSIKRGDMIKMYSALDKGMQVANPEIKIDSQHQA